jgi:hypothetical protein
VVNGVCNQGGDGTETGCGSERAEERDPVIYATTPAASDFDFELGHFIYYVYM